MGEQHTKGPWVQFADQGRTVAILPAGRDGEVCLFDKPYPTNADALVINAAPTLLATLGEIARGRSDNGRPLASETARQMAREALTSCGLSWPAKAEGR